MSWRASGLRAWLLQRVSAVYLAIYFIYVAVVLLVAPPQNYLQLTSWMSGLPMALATAVFFLALLAHAWVGMRDVVIDYIRPFAVRLTVLIFLAGSLLALGLWALRVVLMGAI
jgi:succinate dehydrogenase / fumarate reductase membrane anchor subunit